MVDAYLTINTWHIVASLAILSLLLTGAYRVGDSNGYHRAPSDLRKRAETAEVKAELAEGRERATDKALHERLSALESDYARIRGAALNLAFVAQRELPKGGSRA